MGEDGHLLLSTGRDPSSEGDELSHRACGRWLGNIIETTTGGRGQGWPWPPLRPSLTASRTPDPLPARPVLPAAGT